MPHLPPARLEEQKLLLSDPNYIWTVRNWVKKDGHLVPVDKQQRVLPWWRVKANRLHYSQAAHDE
jgi:hypothetical protein